MKRVVLAVTVLVLVAVLGTWLDWREEHKQLRVAPSPLNKPHVDTAAQMQGGPLTPQRQRTFATLACGGTVETNDRGEISCPVCPEGSDFAPAGDTVTDTGNGAAADPFDTGWTYGGMIFGHFTRSDADEALLKTNGCESHANSMGGDVLLRKAGGQWSRVRYVHGGLASSECQRVGWEGGRDALVCHTGDMHQGIGTDTALLMMVDPTAAPQDDNGEHSWFLSVSDDEGDCTATEAPKETQSASIDRLNLVPGANGRKDLEVLASIGRIKAPAVHDNCPTAPKKSYRLLFHNLGDRFTLEEGLPALQALGQDDCCEVKASTEVRPLRF